MNIDKKVYLSLGSNMGNSYYYLLNAINQINKLEDTIVSNVSSFYKTKPWGNENQGEFINCAVEIHTKLLPFRLLDKINEIEKYLDRVREIHWGPRTIDIDIIFYDYLEINSERLTIPHKYYKKRNFVLVPLLDIIDNPSRILPYINFESENDLNLYKYDKKILISSCLFGDKVRYDGNSNYTRLFMELIKNDYIKVCPEVLGGLPIPRPSCEIRQNKVININGEDVTKEFEEGAQLALEEALLHNVEIALMKEKSPSCGKDYIYNGNFERKLIKGMGIAVEKLIRSKIDVINI